MSSRIKKVITGTPIILFLLGVSMLVGKCIITKNQETAKRYAQYEVWSEGVVLQDYEWLNNGYRATMRNTNSFPVRIRMARLCYQAGEVTYWMDNLPAQACWELTFDKGDRFYIYDASCDLIGFINPIDEPWML